MAENTPVVLAQCTLVTLDEDLCLPDGTLLPAGTDILLAPQTMAHCVRVPGGKSLAEAWGEIAMQGHEHTDMQMELAKYQQELVCMADRATKIEMWATQNGFVPNTTTAA